MSSNPAPAGASSVGPPEGAELEAAAATAGVMSNAATGQVTGSTGTPGGPHPTSQVPPGPGYGSAGWPPYHYPPYSPNPYYPPHPSPYAYNRGSYPYPPAAPGPPSPRTSPGAVAHQPPITKKTDQHMVTLSVNEAEKIKALNDPIVVKFTFREELLELAKLMADQHQDLKSPSFHVSAYPSRKTASNDLMLLLQNKLKRLVLGCVRSSELFVDEEIQHVFDSLVMILRNKDSILPLPTVIKDYATIERKVTLPEDTKQFARILVDCGVHQEINQLSQSNWDEIVVHATPSLRNTLSRVRARFASGAEAVNEIAYNVYVERLKRLRLENGPAVEPRRMDRRIIKTASRQPCDDGKKSSPPVASTTVSSSLPKSFKRPPKPTTERIEPLVVLSIDQEESLKEASEPIVVKFKFPTRMVLLARRTSLRDANTMTGAAKGIDERQRYLFDDSFVKRACNALVQKQSRQKGPCPETDEVEIEGVLPKYVLQLCNSLLQHGYGVHSEITFGECDWDAIRATAPGELCEKIQYAKRTAGFSSSIPESFGLSGTYILMHEVCMDRLRQSLPPTKKQKLSTEDKDVAVLDKGKE